MQSAEHGHRLPLSRFVVIGICALFFLVSLFVFGASVRYGFLSFDDPYLIVNNLTTKGPTVDNLRRAFTTFDPELYIPLTFISYQLNYLVAGLNPAFYHFTNIVLHAINGILVSCLAFFLIGRGWIALFTGLLWMVHPVNTEAVVWLSGRKDLLSTSFYLLTVVSYLRYRSGGGKRMFHLSLLFFLLALLSKVSVFTLPIALLILEGLMRDRREWSMRMAKPLIPFAVLSGIFLAIGIVGKQRVLLSSSLWERAMLACKSSVFYVKNLIFPMNLVPVYPQTTPVTVTSPEFFVPLLLLIAAAALVLWSLRHTKWLAAVSLLFFITIGPSFFNVNKGIGTFFAVDRYVYVPSIWLVVLLSLGIAALSDRLRPRGKTVLAVALCGWTATLAILSAKQTTIWQDDETLFTRILALYPDSISARASLSMVYRERGRMDLEEKILREGLARQRTVAYLTGLGSVLLRKGDAAGAIALYDEAATLDPSNPESAFFRGALEESSGNPDIALRYYEEAIQLDESYTAAYVNAGAILLDQRRLPEAEEKLRLAVAWNPNTVEGLYNLFQTLEFLEKKDEAFVYLQDAYRLSPDISDIAITYAYRLHERGRTAEAIRIMERALEHEPDNAAARRVLNFLRNSAP